MEPHRSRKKKKSENSAAFGATHTSLAWLYLVAAAKLMTMSQFPPSSSKTLSMVAG